MRGAHFLRDSGHTFDAPFFNVSKTEALTMDPQQRLMMESVYEVIENGKSPSLSPWREPRRKLLLADALRLQQLACLWRI